MMDEQRNNSPDESTELVGLMREYAPYDGCFNLAIPGTRIFRRSNIDPDPLSVISQAGICIVGQGAKRVMLGDKVYEYDRSRLAIYSMALPIEARVIQASAAEPYLCLVLDLTPQKIAELAFRVFPYGIPKTQDLQGIQLGHTDKKIIAAAIRLLELLKSPRETELLHELILDEILLRLLASPAGPSLAQIGASESNTGRIVRSISWLRANYKETVTVEELSSLVNMSESAFHRNFKSVTSVSPMQFQKILRLQGAKNFMLSESMDVTTASQRVGYSSASQFSREYTRFFGASPSKDIAKFRGEADMATFKNIASNWA